MITVRAIGAAEVQIGRKRITKSTELVLAVAVYLCVRAGERLTRDEMIDMFWPGGDPAKGRHSLRQMLYKLRLKGFTLDEDGESLLLDRERVDCDAARALADSWPETAEPWMIEDSGEFLPVVTREISPQFREWLDATRSRLAAQYRQAALRQIVQARREGRWADLERWARVVLRTDPLNEEATLARAESAAMAGSKAAALEILDQYMEELGERAGQIALPATVLRRRISERKPEWGGRGRTEVPLVGREDLMRRLTTALANAGEGRGSALLLYGAPGIGKSRVSSELHQFALINGFRVCSVRASQSDSGRPFSLAIAVASALQDLPGLVGTSPAALSLISRLCSPSTRSSLDDAAGPETISPAETAWAIADACAAATHESRVVVSIDDLHNADASSLQVVARIAQISKAHRLLVLATSRLTSRNTLHTSAAHLAAFLSVPVSPLSQSDASVLVSSFSASARRSTSQHLSAAIVRAGGGNPLFLRELTSQRATQHAPSRLPESLAVVIEQRIAAFARHELQLLRAVSLLGPLARFSRLRALLVPRNWDYDAFLEQLELEGVLAMSSSGTIELHECWHDSIRDTLKGTALCAMAYDAAALLATESFTDAGFSNYWRAAELFSLAGSYERSREQFRRVAALFMGRGLPRQAVEALLQSTGLSCDSGSRAELFADLAAAQNAASLHADALASCEEALSCVSDSPSAFSTMRSEVFATLVDSRLRLGTPIRDAVDLLIASVSNTALADSACQRACHVGMRSVLNSGIPDAARAFLTASATSAARYGKSLMGSIVQLMYAAEFGSAEELTQMEHAVAEQCSDGDAPSVRMLALRYRATALRFLGRHQPAADLFEQAVETARSYGAPRDAHLAAASLIFLSLDQADFTQADRWLQEATGFAMPAEDLDLDRSITHARARYLLETGDARGCIETYAPYMDALKSDSSTRRRAADSACLSVAFAQTGGSASARAFCADAIQSLCANKPGPNEDWVAHSVLRCLVALDSPQEALSVHESYLSRRASLADRPLPIAFTELTAARLDRRRAELA
ncbi:MAG: AAA family ATPase [Gemmatimonadetes bacterium]|nr:AAA family ATPase [Gemmatimonadota bacterium]